MSATDPLRGALELIEARGSQPEWSALHIDCAMTGAAMTADEKLVKIRVAIRHHARDMEDWRQRRTWAVRRERDDIDNELYDVVRAICGPALEQDP